MAKFRTLKKRDRRGKRRVVHVGFGAAAHIAGSSDIGSIASSPGNVRRTLERGDRCERCGSERRLRGTKMCAACHAEVKKERR
jgi:hypothetical protein